MTLEQCFDALFKSIEIMEILQMVLIAINAIMMIGSLNRIEEKLDKLLKEDDT